LTKRVSLNDCLEAGPGEFASGVANHGPTGKCSTGYYCPIGATTATSSCGTSFCLSGGRYMSGQECPIGTGYPLACRGRKYYAT